MGIRPISTPFCAPLANAICERVIGTLRREVLDHVVTLHPRSLFHRQRLSPSRSSVGFTTSTDQKLPESSSAKTVTAGQGEAAQVYPDQFFTVGAGPRHRLSTYRGSLARPLFRRLDGLATSTSRPDEVLAPHSPRPCPLPLPLPNVKGFRRGRFDHRRLCREILGNWPNRCSTNCRLPQPPNSSGAD
jgi:hypothetical protein